MQQEVRKASRRHATALRDANRSFNAQPFTESAIHNRAHAQEFARTVIALAKLGRLPVDLVERALLDKGEDMILILAKAAGCSWTTAKELLLMYVAERDLQPDDLSRTFERYSKLSQEMARSIVNFYRQRVKLRTLGNARQGTEDPRPATAKPKKSKTSRGNLARRLACRSGPPGRSTERPDSCKGY